jgi:hypothetical protein
MEWWINALMAVCGYLLGMAFAGSFLGRKWMGTVDVFLHKLLKRDVTTAKYLYWRYFCSLNNPPMPKNLKYPRNLTDKLVLKFCSI